MSSDDAHRGSETNQTNWPFQDEGQIRRAVKQFSQRNTKAGERRRILGRLEATGARVAIVAHELLDIMQWLQGCKPVVVNACYRFGENGILKSFIRIANVFL